VVVPPRYAPGVTAPAVDRFGAAPVLKGHRVPQPMPGTEAFTAHGDGVGVLVLHGFTGNPASVRPLAEELAAAGWAVQLPRLPGHGTSWRRLQRARWCDWVREARAGLAMLRATTPTQVVVGLSMGGTLALHLLQTEPGLAGGVLINPWLALRDPRMRALPLLKWLVPSVSGVGNDIAKPQADERPYTRVPLKALASVLQLQQRVRTHLPAVSQPLLVMTSPQDRVVDPADSRLIVEGVASQDIEHVALERSYHVATLDYDADDLVKRTLGFCQRVASTSHRA